jgi:hypothetical protein
MISRDAEGVAGFDHAVNELEAVQYPRAAIDNIAEKYDLAAFGMGIDGGVQRVFVGRRFGSFVSELFQQFGQFVEAAV